MYPPAFHGLPFSYHRNFLGVGGGTPTAQAAPAPAPTPTFANPNPVATANDRAAALKKLQYGLSSTVAGGAPGISSSASLKSPVMPGTGAAATTGGV